jgi:hypothetical protein
MVRFYVPALAGILLIASLALFAVCGDDDGSPSGSPGPATESSPTPAITDSEEAVIQYKLKVIDWGNRLRAAGAVFTSVIVEYPAELSKIGEMAPREQVFDAFDSIALVQSEYDSTPSPPSLAEEHAVMGDSLTSFRDGETSTRAMYAAWDAGEMATAQVELSEAINGVNSGNSFLEEVIASVTDPDAT